MAYLAFEYIDPQDYLSIEVNAVEKHEYFDGRIYAMADASFDNNFIVSDLTKNIGSFLEGKDCDVLVADQRVTTPLFDSFMYPDLVVVCGEIESKEKGFDTLINPSVIIEVMSASTKGYDMAFKFHYYKQIPSLKEYILIDSTRFFAQCNSKNMDGSWQAVNIEDRNGVLKIATIDMQLPLSDIYRKVSFAR